MASAALLLLLSASAVSPLLHEHLHGHDDEHGSPAHFCAVVLFAGGIVLAAGALRVAAPAAIWRELDRPRAAELFLVAPRYLRQPERGPPGC